MNLATIKEAIRVQVAAASELDQTRVRWVNTAEAGQWRAWPSIDLVFRRPQAIGQDEDRRVFLPADPPVPGDPDAGFLSRTLCGPRTFRVEIRVETDNQDGGTESMSIILRILVRIGRPSIAAALSAVGVNVATIAEGIDADFVADDRMVSLSTMDVVFNAVENDVDTTEPGDFATALRFESTPDKLRSPDGSPAENQVTVVVGDPLEP